MVRCDKPLTELPPLEFLHDRQWAVCGAGLRISTWAAQLVSREGGFGLWECGSAAASVNPSPGRGQARRVSDEAQSEVVGVSLTAPGAGAASPMGVL